MVGELLETQERGFKQFIEFHTNIVKGEINTLRKYVDEPKTSLVFSQKDIGDMKEKCHKAKERLMETEDGLTKANSCIDELYDQQEQLEHHSRRNNVKIGSRTKTPRQKPHRHKSPDKNPLDKIPPRQNILFRNFITFVLRMSYGKEISIWFLAVKYVRHGSIK